MYFSFIYNKKILTFSIQAGLTILNKMFIVLIFINLILILIIY
jgi:hypothetical protein